MTEPPTSDSPSPEEANDRATADSSAELTAASSDAGSDQSQEKRPVRDRVFGRFAFWIVVFPFVVYLCGTMTAGYLEQLRVSYLKGDLDDPHFGEESHGLPGEEEVDISQIEVDPNARFLFGLLPLGKNSFPYTYTATIVLTIASMLPFAWGYFRAPFRVTFLSFVVGVVGVVLWIGLVWVDEQFLGLGKMLSSGRAAFNPLEELKNDRQWLYQFMAIRFLGLVVIVPIIEEFFVRGFLIRYVDDPDWDELPLGQATWKGWLAPTVYGVIAHPAEPLSALVWFSLVSWLYKRTGSIWDCVIAHAVTNLLLGLYVLKYSAWHLW